MARILIPSVSFFKKSAGYLEDMKVRLQANNALMTDVLHSLRPVGEAKVAARMVCAAEKGLDGIEDCAGPLEDPKVSLKKGDTQTIATEFPEGHVERAGEGRKRGGRRRLPTRRRRRRTGRRSAPRPRRARRPRRRRSPRPPSPRPPRRRRPRRPRRRSPRPPRWKSPRLPGGEEGQGPPGQGREEGAPVKTPPKATPKAAAKPAVMSQLADLIKQSAKETAAEIRAAKKAGA